MYTLHSDWNYREQNIESLTRLKLEAIALTNYLLTFLSREEHQKEHGAKRNEGKSDSEEDEEDDEEDPKEGEEDPKEGEEDPKEGEEDPKEVDGDEEKEKAKEMPETQVGSSQDSLQDAQGSQTQI